MTECLSNPNESIERSYIVSRHSVTSYAFWGADKYKKTIMAANRI